MTAGGAEARQPLPVAAGAAQSTQTGHMQLAVLEVTLRIIWTAQKIGRWPRPGTEHGKQPSNTRRAGAVHAEDDDLSGCSLRIGIRHCSIPTIDRLMWQWTRYATGASVPPSANNADQTIGRSVEIVRSNECGSAFPTDTAQLAAALEHRAQLLTQRFTDGFGPEATGIARIFAARPCNRTAEFANQYSPGCRTRAR